MNQKLSDSGETEKGYIRLKKAFTEAFIKLFSTDLMDDLILIGERMKGNRGYSSLMAAILP